jgi:pimeloyl-ACP methyl ester carboxylesterase
MKLFRNFFKFISGVITGYVLGICSCLFWRLVRADPRFTPIIPQNKAKKGVTFLKGKTGSTYTIQHSIENGIERISYIPKEPLFETPILMQHGMFLGAWSWQSWQKLLVEWGWESHAISLPGHGNSPLQRPISKCTLDYYLGFLHTEVMKSPRIPVVFGHSMGGALIQWHWKYFGQFPAAVFVASWVSYAALLDGAIPIISKDPGIIWRMMVTWDASSWVRNPKRAAEKFLSPDALVTPEEFHARLNSESALVVFQHNPPFWLPSESVQTPSLWLIGERDAVVTVKGTQASARHYKGECVVIPGAGHNLMMEPNYRQTAEKIHAWLVSQVIE